MIVPSAIVNFARSIAEPHNGDKDHQYYKMEVLFEVIIERDGAVQK